MQLHERPTENTARDVPFDFGGVIFWLVAGCVSVVVIIVSLAKFLPF